MLDHCTFPAQRRSRVSAVFSTAPLHHGRTMSIDLTSLHLQAAFKSYLDNDDLEGLVSDIQIYLSDYMDADQIEELAHDWVVDIESVEELD